MAMPANPATLPSPGTFSPRNEVQRAQHQSDFQQPLAEIVAQRALLVGFGGFVGLLGFFLLRVLLFGVFLSLFFVAGVQLLGCIAFGVEHRQETFAQFHVVEFDAVGLVVCPIVIGRRFVHDGRRVRAVRCDGDHCQQHRQYGCQHPYRLPHRIVLILTSLVMNLQFCHGFRIIS